MEKQTKNLFWSKFFIGFTIVVILALMIFKGRIEQYFSGEIKTMSNNKMTANDKDSLFSIVFEKGQESVFDFTFLEFGSKGCIACRKMEDVMKIITEENRKVKVIFLNVNEEKGKKLADFYGVVSIPTQILLDKNGVEYFRHSGFIEASELQTKFR